MSSTAAFHLRPMTPDDAGAVRQLWAHRFGGAPATRQKWIDAVLDPDHTATARIATARADLSVVGFGMLEVGSRAYTRRYLGLDALDLSAPLADRNGLFHLCCVREAWEGRGVGSALHARRLRLLAERDVVQAFGIAWHRPHTVDSRVLFEKHDFTALATVDQYYARTTPRSKCPDCGGPCTCTASLYTRPLHRATGRS